MTPKLKLSNLSHRTKNIIIFVLLFTTVTFSYAYFSGLKTNSLPQGIPQQNTQDNQPSPTTAPIVEFKDSFTTEIILTQLSAFFYRNPPPKKLENLSSATNEIECIDLDHFSTTTSQEISKYANDKHKAGTLPNVQPGTFIDDDLKYIFSEVETLVGTHEDERTPELQAEYWSICRNDNYYFTTHIEKSVPKQLSFIKPAFAGGGGGWSAILTIYDRNAKEIIYQQSLKEDAQKIFDEDRTAYFSCGTITHFSNNTLYLTCGGGDGCSGRGSLYSINLDSLDLTEEYTCGNTLLQEDSCRIDRCIDQNGEYYNKPLFE